MITQMLRLPDDESILLGRREDRADPAPFASFAGCEYRSVAALVAACPEFAREDALPQYCALCLHFSGNAWLAIEDPNDYRERYALLLQSCDDAPDTMPSAADFGPFDLSEIGSPRLRNGRLVFYAEETFHSIPYRVEAAWPTPGDDGVRFLLLPYVS